MSIPAARTGRPDHMEQFRHFLGFMKLSLLGNKNFVTVSKSDRIVTWPSGDSEENETKNQSRHEILL